MDEAQVFQKNNLFYCEGLLNMTEVLKLYSMFILVEEIPIDPTTVSTSTSSTTGLFCSLLVHPFVVVAIVVVVLVVVWRFPPRC